MVWGFLTHGFGIPSKRFTAVMLLFFPSFAWFFLFDFTASSYIESLAVNLIWIYIGKALFYISIAVSAIIGSIISERLNRRRFLEFWIVFGVIATTSFGVFQGLIFFLLLGVLAGASFGLGFPSSLAFLADSTTVEERARVSGVAILVTFISIILAVGVLSMLHLELVEYLLISIILRAISCFALLLDPCERAVCKRKNWMAVLNTYGFLLYFVSWLMFTLAGGISGFIKPLQSLEYESVRILGSVVQYVGVVPSALISGFASDRFGRKKTLIFGLITLGISYALFSVATSSTTYLLTKIISGVAWGIILVVYCLTVIGDFAVSCSKEKFYAIGMVVPFILYSIFKIFSDAISPSIPNSLISSILSMILFISVIPLLYAPETLPWKKIRQRRFSEHIKKLKKLVEEEETQTFE